MRGYDWIITDDHLIMTSARSECRVVLRRCLAIVLRKEGCQGDPGDFWMYESGYLLFQGLLSANSICWWNSALNGATKSLVYKGYVNPGALLVGSEPCALEVLRGAWARRVLQPPAGYQIVSVEDIEDCNVLPVPQTQWTPLPEAVCAVVLRLSSQGRPAGVETIRESLMMAFPHVSPPTERILYDTLVQLSTERKLYHTSRGYFIVTPERRRSRSHSRGRRKQDDVSTSGKTMLMSTEEALVLVHGEMTTIRDGDVTHQCIQTNLADVICGGNASDKILIARTGKRRSASFPAPKSPDRRGSFRLWGTSRRLRRSASTRTIARHYTDSSSSTEYPTSSDSAQTPKKESLLFRLFRRSKRSQCQIGTFSAQFPPTEWFNSKAIHLHNVGTQTVSTKDDSTVSLPYYYTESATSSKSATLPRRHRRQLSNDSTYVASFIESRDHSPTFRPNGSYASGSLSRTILRTPNHSTSKSRDSSRKTSHASLSPKIHPTTVPENEKEKPIKVTDTPKIDTLRRRVIETSKTSSLESLKTSHSNEEKQRRSKEEYSPLSNLASVDNSGPSSIESQKSGKTESSATSGPSSLESQKTVIKNSSYSDKKRAPKRNISTTNTPVLNASNLSHSNSFTLQVTTKQNGTNISNINTNATISNGTNSNTKIYVQNSPVRSVITFENGRNSTSNPNLVIINGKTEPSSLDVNKYTINGEEIKTKNTNLKDTSKNNSTTNIENLTKADEMNNRKLSLQMPRDSLSYRNLIKNVATTSNKEYNSKSNPDSPINNGFREFTRNSFDTVTTPTKNLTDSKTSLDKSYQSIAEKNILGSEPNIFKDDERDKTLTRQKEHQFPSLSDLSFNFTSLAAQKILKGVSINSIDTLVELNMAANAEKQNNCDVIHTDFGLV